MITCPRRMETGSRDGAEGLDDYAPGHGLVGQSRGCTYCGSLPPEEFMAMVRARAVVEPTDKSYKTYIGPQGEAGKAKFYFQHLDEFQRREFVKLLSADQIALEYPGHFYVLPFFVTTAPDVPTP